MTNRFKPVADLAGCEFNLKLLRCENRSAADIGQEIHIATQVLSPRLLVVSSHGPGMLAEYGSVARYCTQNISVPLLLIPSQMDPNEVNNKVLVVLNTQSDIDHVLQWAEKYCVSKGDTIVVAHQENLEFDGQQVEKQLKQLGAADIIFQQLQQQDQSRQDKEMNQEGELQVESAQGRQVCELASEYKARVVVMASYAGSDVMMEIMYGGSAAYVTRFCKRPLLLLKQSQQAGDNQ
eukprot:TRINITY_DN7785_c0_g1_i4.p3 TRINITY_DN7785_c0_g1~~TRINITY_DN7785_c0_g1_i4.p3  ORF type:complete len:258 (-),score=31.64 TRINITY_DN7785_c0_g1_i4:230-937(-)